jgi:hypothetical protein
VVFNVVITVPESRNETAMKILGTLALLFGAAMFAFVAMAYLELRTAATSGAMPSVVEMPLTKIVGPELFDSDDATIKPATLVANVMTRLYLIGAGALLFVMLGVFLVVAQSRRNGQKTP